MLVWHGVISGDWILSSHRYGTICVREYFVMLNTWCEVLL